MIDLQKKEIVTSFILHILETWSKHEDKYVEDMSNFFHETFSGFGTEFSEVWKSKQDMIDQQILEHDQAPEGFKYKHRNFEVYTADNQTFICCFIMDFIFDMVNHTMELNDYRNSVVIRLENDKPIVTHWHASKGGLSNDSVFPGLTGPTKYEEVTVLFTDFVGFTRTVSTIPAITLVNELNEIFSAFDQISRKHKVLKVKTIGDAYMAVAGLEQDGNPHTKSCIEVAKDMITYLSKRNETSAWKWELRAGIHSGPIVGGFIGYDQTDFDIWGDTVNIASHMESCSEPGRINISAYSYHMVNQDVQCEYRGKIDAKGKGEIDMYFVKK